MLSSFLSLKHLGLLPLVGIKRFVYFASKAFKLRKPLSMGSLLMEKMEF